MQYERYNQIYDDVENLFNNERINITKSCKKINISTRYYYHVCEVQQKPSVASEQYRLINTKQIGGCKVKPKAFTIPK